MNHKRPKSKDLTWHKGPPPTPGWYLANTGKYSGLWSWWDGAQWSFAVGDHYGSRYAERSAKNKRPTDEQARVYWSDHWPENARCDRQGNPTEQPTVWTGVYIEFNSPGTNSIAYLTSGAIRKPVWSGQLQYGDTLQLNFGEPK